MKPNAADTNNVDLRGANRVEAGSIEAGDVAAGPSPSPSRWRAYRRIAGFLALTLPLMPVQWVLIRVSPTAARWFPHWYHRQVCRIIGVRVRVHGEVPRGRAVLLVANHVSWLDIPVLSAVAPVAFVAKTEVGRWPLVGSLVRLQQCVFVDRTRRVSIGDTADDMIKRLGEGGSIVLFPEGTSTDGNRVLPFRSSLFAAVGPALAGVGGFGAGGAAMPLIQTAALVYTRRDGLPLTWADRRALGYYGDIGIGESAISTLGGGPLEVEVRLGPPRPLSDFADRKALARHAEAEVRAGVRTIMRGG